MTDDGMPGCRTGLITRARFVVRELADLSRELRSHFMRREVDQMPRSEPGPAGARPEGDEDR